VERLAYSRSIISKNRDLIVNQGPVFYALQGVVTILCLGADAMLSLVPKSGFAAQISVPSLPDTSSDTEMTLIDPAFHRSKPEAGIEAIPPASDKGMKASKDKAKIEVATITLVHGDVLILMGDDFEVIRAG